MSIESTAMVSAMTKNKTIADALDTFKNKVDQDNSEQVKGLTDIVDSVGACVGGIFKTMSWVWLAVICVGGLIVLWGLWVGLKFLLSPAGQDGAREIAKAGANKIRYTPIIPV
jgi:beta-lactamase regulating signal transducer with metallopeptidase domain